MKTNYLVCYDIKDDKRLRRVFSLTKQCGIHLQYSVFYCRFTWVELQKFKSNLAEIINKKEDDIRIYPLPNEVKTVVIGCGDRIPEGINIFMT